MRIDAAVIESQSRSLVQELAHKSNQPLEEVRRIYETEFRLLEEQARVKTFLPIIAARRARMILATF